MQTDSSPVKKTYERGKSYFLHLITRCSRTEQEIRRKLRDKDYTQNVIEQVIAFAYEYKYLDDRQYALNWVEYKLSLKKIGKRKIRFELQRKGVPTQYIDDAIEHFFESDAVDESETALECLRKNDYKFKHENAYKNRQKAYQLLNYRGFSIEIISQVINTYFSDPD